MKEYLHFHNKFHRQLDQYRPNTIYLSYIVNASRLIHTHTLTLWEFDLRRMQRHTPKEHFSHRPWLELPILNRENISHTTNPLISLSKYLCMRVLPFCRKNIYWFFFFFKRKLHLFFFCISHSLVYCVDSLEKSFASVSWHSVFPFSFISILFHLIVDVICAFQVFIVLLKNTGNVWNLFFFASGWSWQMYIKRNTQQNLNELKECETCLDFGNSPNF